MKSQEYYQFIKEIQEEEFPGLIDEDEYIRQDDGRHFFFAPSHHFCMGLITKKIVHDLKENKKKLLSVGCGPAHLERLLVSRLNVEPENITLADISEEWVPPDFKFYKFDMHKEWPWLGGTFDYVIFPESTLINVNFAGKLLDTPEGFRQPLREEGLYNLLNRAVAVLNAPGQIRLIDSVADIVSNPVKARIEKKSSSIKMYQKGELIYLLKK